MKKILIFSHALELGGAERALLGLLEAIDTKEYCVDLFLMRHEGELMKYIPETINLLPEIPQYACLAVPFSSVIRKGQMGMAVGRFVGKIKATERVQRLRLPEDNDVALQFSHKYTLPFVPKINNVEYDLAISFLTPHYFVAEKTKARKKIAWIHTDYSTVSVDVEEQLKMWNCYDWIASISDEVSRSFLKVFPELERKIVLIPNVLPIKSIQLQKKEFDAKAEMPCDGSIRLLSIGRFCYAKNFDSVPFICKAIREQGIDIKWYLIGYGGDEALIRNRIEDAGMQDYVIVLGKKSNPYPYIQACDLYVQPSRYEGKCVSVVEAQMLNKPVIIANYPTAKSQLKDGFDGVIVQQETTECAKGIVATIEDTNLVNEIIENTKLGSYSDTSISKIINRFLGDELL